MNTIKEIGPIEDYTDIEDAIEAVLQSLLDDHFLLTNVHLESGVIEGNGVITLSFVLPYTTVMTLYRDELKTELGEGYSEESINDRNAQETFVYTFKVKDHKLQVNMSDLRLSNPRLRQPLTTGFKLFVQSDTHVDLYQFIRGGLLSTYPYSVLRYLYQNECAGMHGTGDWYDVDDNREIYFSIVFHRFDESEHMLSNSIIATIN